MKKARIFLGLTATACLCTALSFGMNFGNFAENQNVILSSVEALAQNESGGDVIKCYCMAWYQADDDCAVDGGDKDSVCAQSQPGGNVNCSDYNSNCK